MLPLTAAGIGSGLSSASAAPPPAKRDLFKELGVTPVINAGVTITFLVRITNVA